MVFTLSVVVPVFNEQAVLREFHQRTVEALRMIGCGYEIVYVNDGSSDESMMILQTLRQQDAGVTVIDLSRNFGKEIALTAGLDKSVGDAVVVIDADLQDPPELMAEFVREWQSGHDVVYARRVARDGESWMKKATAKAFYRIAGHLSRVNIPEDTGDFRLMSRRAVDALLGLRERHRFMKGLFAWIGFPSKAVFYRRQPRFAGVSKWSYWSLWNLALEGLTSFTIAPLRLATYVGVVIALMGFAFAGAIIYRTIAYGEVVRGYPSLMVAVLFLGGVQLIAIGALGEYVGRVFNEVKRRPLYLTKGFSPSAAYLAKQQAALTSRRRVQDRRTVADDDGA